MEFKITPIEALVNQLQVFLPRPRAIIGVDGICCDSRMAVMGELCLQLKYGALSVSECPRAAHLKAKIEDAQRTGGVVVEGAQLRRVFHEMGVKPDVSIYVIPAPTSECTQLFEDILAKGEHDLLATLSRREDKDTVKYHRAYNPLTHADFLIAAHLHE